MLKALILCLLSASLVTAGFFTPSTEKPDATVKEGSSVVIEVDENDGDTKVSVSPKDAAYDRHTDKLPEKLQETKEKIKGAASSILPGTHQAQDERIIAENEANGAKTGDTVGKVKDTVTEAKERVKEAAKDKAEDIKEGAKQQAYDTMESAKRAREEAGRKVEGVKEKAKKTVEEYEEEGKKGMKGLFGYLTRPFRMLSGGWRTLASALHLMGLAVAYGMCAWVTFGSGRVLAQALPKVQLLMVQSRISPVYFRAMAASVGTALVGYLMSRSSKRGMLGGLDLAASLAMVLGNMFYVEPRSTKVLFERMRKEKEEGMATKDEGVVAEEPVVGSKTETSEEPTGGKQGRSEPTGGKQARSAIIRRLSLSSSLLNVATLVPLTCHILRLAQQLNAKC
ncbi:late embryogenesis abundant domain-containing protein / LEA domain-containing protein [Striga hermonthica]|uniref:Late embryogenesis abundant domain-containing protein / LEA domain-containing protein n=1 Tax=Striga hermonthica TaxID=68872 RepID=A0A9N7RPL6_STRHE|nr:late embryogenesis abundant domain-containing protein / LEA domain-containing protein [Striga hermonthica]